MPYKLNVNTAGGYVMVEHYGVTNLDESIEVGQTALQLAMEQNLSRIFIDISRIEGKPAIIDLFLSTKYHAENAPVRLKAAMLGRPDQEPDMGFIETVGVNRGMYIKVFIDRTAALAWLAGE